MSKSEKQAKLKVLEIGAYIKPQARLIPGWQEAEILTLDVVEEYEPDILCNADSVPEEYWGIFDGVFASHVLEHFDWFLGPTIIEHWVELLKPGGELHIVVPSAEWAAREILSENPSPATWPHMYGGGVTPYDVHRTMFTMLLLRKYFDQAGLQVQIARTVPYKIAVQEQPLRAEQHYIKAVKNS